jgi:signal transduction histidine kinase
LLLDTDRIEQVLINLLGNALKFTPEAGGIHVSLRYSPETETAAVAIQDTGPGIAPEDQEIIFDEFAQVGKHAKTQQRDGSGLGLAIAKRIVEAHSGRITLESSPGMGSTFTFTVPAREAHGNSSTAVPA